MWKTPLLVCWLVISAFSADFKILQVIPFGSSSVKISFNQNASNLSIKEYSLKDSRNFLDIQAILTVPKKSYHFSNQIQVSIAQNTTQITRIVIKMGKDNMYQTRFVDKNLYISVIDKLPENSSTSKKNSQSSTSKKSLEKSSKPSPQINEKSITPKKTTPIKAQVSKIPPKSPTLPKNPKNKEKYRIVIDPGHGGKDCGAMGVTKVCEKHIVLSVGKFLDQELKKRGYTTYMTRDKDTYVNLRERTELANAKGAHLFVSIHANSVPKTSNDSPQGIETYFLSTARSERARKVAELENKDDVEVMNYFSKFSFLSSLNSHRLIASNKLAIDIQFGILRELRRNYQGIVDGGVREGPFWVLAGALMPSVLIEVGYNSNPIEAKRINDSRYQRFLAKGIADGIDGYFAKNR